MTVQIKYLKVIGMLESENFNNPIISECLKAIESETTFSFFDNNNKASKNHILHIYSSRAKLENELRPETPFVVGHEALLPKLESTELEYVNICNICSEVGTFLIFTDYDYTVFSGILHSKRTLSEVREKMNGSEHYSEYVFVNRELKE